MCGRAAVWFALRRGVIGRLVAVVAVASFACYLWLGEHDPRAAFFLPWSRFWELLAGAAMIGVEMPRRWAGAASAAGLALVAASVALVSVDIEFPGAALVFPVAGTCLLLATHSSRLNSQVLASRLRWASASSATRFISGTGRCFRCCATSTAHLPWL